MQRLQKNRTKLLQVPPPDAMSRGLAIGSGRSPRVPAIASGRYAPRMTTFGETLRLSEEIAAALARAGPVVALESSLIAQGLPVPHNLETAERSEAAVREEGATPATVALDGGRLIVGADADLLERLADPTNQPLKAASRDLGPLLASRRLASTTVSATVRAAHLAGIAVLATGGIGGVHRGATISHDVSSDIDELAATPVAVVCSGPKSILDLPATFELLETRRVPLIGYGTGEMPAFYSTGSGRPLVHRVEDPAQAASVLAAHRSIAGSGGLLFLQPPPAELAIPLDEVEAWIEMAIRDADAHRISGGAVTPHVLSYLAQASEGRTLRANVGLIVNNARTAARIAVALAHR
jgi:pseudouridine-5'-phosphate glycosidase